MHTIVYNWRDLEQFGIRTLTGEACAYSMRLLCDLNDEGVSLLMDYFGLGGNPFFPSPWNSTVNGKPAIASVMLDKTLLQSIALFICWREGYAGAVVTPNHAIVGCDAETLAKYENAGIEGLRVYRNPKANGPHSGSRNIHAATGRTL